MIIDASIIEVMETWPLQLSVQTRSGRYHVALTEQTKIVHQGQHVTPDRVVPGLRVRVEGDLSNERSMVARRIDLQE